MTIRYGIIGAGRMGTYHASQLEKIDGARIQAVCDMDSERASSLAKKTGCKAYTNCEEMITQEELDAVYLCTPVRGRLEQVKALTDNRIDCFIEKPLAVSISEGEAIKQLVENSGIICTVGFQWRYMDFVQKAKELLANEPISLISGRYYWTVPVVKWIQNRYLGGGQIFDQNIHMVDLGIYMAGPVNHLYSVFNQKTTVGEMENWDGYSTTMKFQDGTVGNFYSTYALYQEVGEEPFVDIVQKNRLMRITSGKLIVKTPGKEEIYYSKNKTGEINKNFHKALVNRDSSNIKTPVSEALHTLKVVLAANQSAQKAEIVRIEQYKNYGLDDLKQLEAPMHRNKGETK